MIQILFSMVSGAEQRYISEAITEIQNVRAQQWGPGMEKVPPGSAAFPQGCISSQGSCHNARRQTCLVISKALLSFLLAAEKPKRLF